MADDLNVALVGYGMAGKTFHAPLIAATPGLRLRTIVSGNAAKVAADFPQVPTTADLAGALADPAVDLVVVATPDALHAAHGHAALDAGKHLVIDKPFAATLADAQSLADHAKRAGRVLSVFHNRRWDSDFLTLSRLIADDALGEVVQFESHYDRFRPVVVDQWKERPGAGPWFGLGPHVVDQAVRLFGMPQAVYADFAQLKDEALTTDYFHVLLRYPRLRVILHATQLAPVPDLRFCVHGLKGSFVKYGLDPQEAALAAGQRPGGEGWGVDPRPGVLTQIVSGAATCAPIAGVPGDYRAYYAALRAAIVDGGPNPASPEEALEVMSLLDLGVRSAAAREELEVAPRLSRTAR